MATEILNLDEIVAGQEQPEVTHNTALRQIEGRFVVLNRTSSVPGAPSEGDTYLVTSGNWADTSDHTDDIAHYLNGGWVYYAPAEGPPLWVVDEEAYYAYDGANWIQVTSGGGSGPVTILDDLVDVSVSSSISEWHQIYYDGSGWVNGIPAHVVPAQSVSDSGTVTINLSLGQWVNLTPTGDITSLSFTNWPSSTDMVPVTLRVDNSGSPQYDITWGSIDFGDATPPTVSDYSHITVVLYTSDGGSTIEAVVTWTKA